MKDPYSKISSLTAYLYSMELGQPPLYAEVNRVTRDMDMTQIEHLGPYICVLFRVLNRGELGKAADDKIVTGQMQGGVFVNYAGSFLAWRGAPMKEEWITPFELN